MYAKYEPAPRTDSNLWELEVNPSIGSPSGTAQRRTQWTDFRIQDLSVSADGIRLCFTRSSVQDNVYLGDLQARGTRLASLRRLTLEDATNIAFAWTPDSKAVLFQSDRDGQFHLYKQDINKDAPQLITSGPDNETVPRVSPDGQWLLYFLDDTLGGTKRRLMRMPLAGGAAQQILISAEAALYDCSHTARGACVLAETRGKVLIFSLLDPIKGRGSKILETALATGYPAISPDGQHIAFGLLMNRIRTIDLHGATEGEITVSGAQNLQYLEWAADGTGFFIADLQPAGARLLYVERSGVSQVLWTRRHGSDLGPIPSPNGRYLAMNMDEENANVWMVENP
jgi:Tol biopolymer transport system component